MYVNDKSILIVDKYPPIYFKVIIVFSKNHTKKKSI